MRDKELLPTATVRRATGAGRRSGQIAAHRLSLVIQYGVAATTLPTIALLRRWVRAAQERDVAVLLRFTGTREACTLNATFRGKEYATNVLTFVYDDVVPLAGDLVVCAPVLRHEAKSQSKTLATTARTSSYTACSTCKATTTTAIVPHARWKPARARSSPGWE